MNFCTSAGLSSLGTSLGLSQTTGYCPYLPLLALTVATKWFHLCQINPYFHFMTDDWFVLVVALLTAIDLIVDLIPAVSTGWHAVHTAITPLLGGFVAAATTTSFPTIPGLSASGLTLHLASIALAGSGQSAGLAATIVMFLAGFVLAGLVHLHRFGGRAVANVGHVFTGGLSNVVISLAEDIVAFVGILLSFFAPIIMLIIVVLVVLFLIFTFKYILRGLRFLQGGQRKGTAA